MTEIVVQLTPSAECTIYDEVFLVGRALTPTDWLGLYAALPNSAITDPQAQIGWEEVYGPNYDATPNDVFVMANGRARCRWIAATSSIAVDALIPGLGLDEQGRTTFWIDDDDTLVQLTRVSSCTLVEWTDERAVLRVVLQGLGATQTYRAELFITLQRGWSGPRFELYPSPRADGVALGAHVRWTALSVEQLYATYRHNGNHLAFHSDIAWTAYWNQTGSSSENWAALATQDSTHTLTATRDIDTFRLVTDTVAYAATRKGLAISADFDTAAAGYVSARLFFSRASRVLLPSEHRTTQGSVGVDETFGPYVRNTATAEGASSRIIDTTLDDLGLRPGSYFVFVLDRISGAGSTTVKLTTTLGTFSTSSLGTDWAPHAIDVTPVVRWSDPTDVLQLDTWTAATAVDVAAVLLVPVTMQEPGYESYDGARDLAFSDLYDVRTVPELVSR
jgi:hypothetical protein